MVPRAGGRVTASLKHPDSARPRVKTEGKAEGGACGIPSAVRVRANVIRIAHADFVGIDMRPT